MFHTDLIPVRSRTPFKNYHTESKLGMTYCSLRSLFDSPPQMLYVGLELGFRFRVMVRVEYFEYLVISIPLQRGNTWVRVYRVYRVKYEG